MYLSRQALPKLVIYLVCAVGGLCSSCARKIPDAGREDSGQEELAANRSIEDKAKSNAPDERDVAVSLRATDRQAVQTFCADCHAMPRATSSPRDEWEMEVAQGHRLYADSGRKDLSVPDEAISLAYFRSAAPNELRMPDSITKHPKTNLELHPQTVRRPGVRPPGITNVQWHLLGNDSAPLLVYCDVSTGMILAADPAKPDQPIANLGTLLQPVHTEVCDLDGDGLSDLVVADIGEFNANDTDLGRVVWLKNQGGKFKKKVLLDELSRVSDVRPGDFDNDGDVDLLVGVFGWRNSGEILYLEQTTGPEDSEPKFMRRQVDDRHGPVHLPTADLNGDGHLDFIALISQEHEVVEAFINDGTGSFTAHVLWKAPDPAYGSSGIELTDLDGDGDLDVLYTNGDSFDRGIKPYHSVQWLENDGDLDFTHHHICWMPGVQTAKSGDFDGDGDLDIVAACLIVGDQDKLFVSPEHSSVVLIEQVSPGKFETAQVESGTNRHLSIAVGDFNSDNVDDFAVGNFMRNESAENPDLTLWHTKRPN